MSCLEQSYCFQINLATHQLFDHFHVIARENAGNCCCKEPIHCIKGVVLPITRKEKHNYRLELRLCNIVCVHDNRSKAIFQGKVSRSRSNRIQF